jgi:CRISPR-associated protein Cas1
LAFRTVLIESPCRCSYQSGYLCVRQQDGTTKVHLSEISSLVLGTEQVMMSAYLLAELAKSKIPLVVSDEKHNPVGQYLPLYGAHNVSARVNEQLEWGLPIKKRVWQRVVKDKIFQQARVLEDNDLLKEARALHGAALEVRSGDVTNREAQAARIYFSALFGPEFNRSTDCAVNAGLDYGYAILLSMVSREIAARGYLTQVGVNHRNEFNQLNLACDFMEPFRPIVDRLVCTYVSGSFGKDEKRTLVDVGNTQLAYRGGSYKLHSVVSLYIQDCINALNKKISVDEIESFDIP